MKKRGHDYVKAPDFINQRLAKAFANPIRVEIMIELNRREPHQRVMSVTGFVKAHPHYSHPRVYRHFRKLEELECIELVEKKSGGRRRGGVEHFYRATTESLFDETGWASLPTSLMGSITTGVFTTYANRVAEATKAGTIDTRPDRHFTWLDPHFDKKAWDETIEEVDTLFHRIPIRQAEAAARLAKSGEEPIPVTVALACFESPKASESAD